MEHFARQKKLTNGANFNPATGESLGSVAPASSETIQFAVESAKAAQKDWAKHPAKDRGKILQNAARLLRESNERLAKIETMDTGKPISESSSVDILSAAECLEYFGIVAGLSGRQIDLGRSFAYTRLEPLGICAGIGAWNYPIQIAAWKAAPALACGNALIFKPSGKNATKCTIPRRDFR